MPRKTSVAANLLSYKDTSRTNSLEDDLNMNVCNSHHLNKISEHCDNDADDEHSINDDCGNHSAKRYQNDNNDEIVRANNENFCDCEGQVIISGSSIDDGDQVDSHQNNCSNVINVGNIINNKHIKNSSSNYKNDSTICDSIETTIPFNNINRVSCNSSSAIKTNHNSHHNNVTNPVMSSVSLSSLSSSSAPLPSLVQLPQISATVARSTPPPQRGATIVSHYNDLKNSGIYNEDNGCTEFTGVLGSPSYRSAGGYLIAVHRKLSRQDTYFLSYHKTRPSLFGVPLLIPCYEGGTNKDLYCAVWVQVARLLSPLPSTPPDQSNHATDW